MSLGLILITGLAIATIVVSTKVREHSKRIKGLEDLKKGSEEKK